MVPLGFWFLQGGWLAWRIMLFFFPLHVHWNAPFKSLRGYVWFCCFGLTYFKQVSKASSHHFCFQRMGSCRRFKTKTWRRHRWSLHHLPTSSSPKKTPGCTRMYTLGRCTYWFWSTTKPRCRKQKPKGHPEKEFLTFSHRPGRCSWITTRPCCSRRLRPTLPVPKSFRCRGSIRMRRRGGGLVSKWAEFSLRI